MAVSEAVAIMQLGNFASHQQHSAHSGVLRVTILETRRHH